MNGKLPLAIWLAVVITLIGLAPIDAAKVVRQKTKTHAANHDHVRLTHALPSHSQPHQSHHAPSHAYPHQQQRVPQSQSYPPQTHASAPALPVQTHAPALPAQTHASAPALPAQSYPSSPAVPNTNSNRPIGWNVGHSDGAQRQTVSNTNSAAPPAHTSYVPNNNGAVSPSYPSNTNFNQQPNTGFQPSYPGQSFGGNNAPSYPGGYPQQQHPQQVPYNPNPAGGYPIQQQPSYIPGNGGQQPVVNNYYQEQQKSGGGVGSALQTAAIAGIGGLALYGALKPSEEKTIIIHDGQTGAPPAAVPASPPGAAVAQPAAIPAVAQPAAIPAVAQPAAVPAVPAPGVFVTPLPATETASSIPLAPLAPLPQDPAQSSIPLAPLPEQTSTVPLAALPDQSTVIPVSSQPAVVTNTVETTTRFPVSDVTLGVRTLGTENAGPQLAPINTPAKQDAAHAPLQGGATSNFVIFSMSFYACIALVVSKLI